MTALTIGKLAKATDVKVPTIRFYEQIGLMPEADRAENDRRMYGDDDVQRLSFIKHARQLGFGVDGIRTLLELADHPDRGCEDADELAKSQLVTVEDKIAQLQSLRDELKRMIADGHHGSARECRVIESIANHALCAHDH